MSFRYYWKNTLVLLIVAIALIFSGCASTSEPRSYIDTHHNWNHDLNPWHDGEIRSDWAIVDIGPDLLKWDRSASEQLYGDFKDFW